MWHQIATADEASVICAQEILKIESVRQVVSLWTWPAVSNAKWETMPLFCILRFGPAAGISAVFQLKKASALLELDPL